MRGRVVATAAAGALFGAGLVVSGMTDPRKVIGFLDFTGSWNPQLIAVMGGAVAVYASLLALLGRAGGARLLPPRNNRIDRSLLVGAAIFGVGWGLSGYCPGPAIVSLGSGARGAFVFVAAMIAGLLAAGLVRSRAPGCDTTPDNTRAVAHDAPVTGELHSPSPPAPPTRLARKLGTGDAVIVGWGAMIGAGVFSAIGPAARAAGNAMVVSLLVAGALAYCNATSSAALAALHPESGGAYVYGRRRLGHVWGFLAGWGFIVGKLASCAAMALTFGHYVAPALARPLAIAAVATLTTVNYFGVRKTAAATTLIVALVLAALAVCVFAAAAGGGARWDRLWPLEPVGPRGVLQAAGLLFFAFAGYARIATLGEEVADPARAIPRAIPAALGLTLIVYAAVVAASLAAAGSGALAASATPLADAVRAGRFASLAVVARIGAAIGSLGVLLSLIAGISRTMFAMAAAGDLPAALAAVHPRHQVPHRAEVAVGLGVVLLVAVLDVGAAIGFSAFTVLAYYAIANAAALTLSRDERRWPRPLAALGLAGCITVAASLPAATVIGGAVVLASGLIVFRIYSMFRTQ